MYSFVLLVFQNGESNLLLTKRKGAKIYSEHGRHEMNERIFFRKAQQATQVLRFSLMSLSKSKKIKPVNYFFAKLRCYANPGLSLGSVEMPGRQYYE